MVKIPKSIAFCYLKQHYSIEMMNNIILSEISDFFENNHILYHFSWEISCFNHDKSCFTDG